jgi:anti-sigma B factor antagonist
LNCQASGNGHFFRQLRTTPRRVGALSSLDSESEFPKQGKAQWAMTQQEASEIQYAEIDQDIVVLRVIGRGTYQNSMSLERLDHQYEQQHRPVRYILDLEQCNYMDSTFMGVLAYLGSRQLQHQGNRTIVVNLNKHTRKLLSILGLTNILQVQEEESDYSPKQAQFVAPAEPEADKLDRITHMLQAHQQLADLTSENEVRFKNVLAVLGESLKREIDKKTEDDDAS